MSEGGPAPLSCPRPRSNNTFSRGASCSVRHTSWLYLARAAVDTFAFIAASMSGAEWCCQFCGRAFTEERSKKRHEKNKSCSPQAQPGPSMPTHITDGITRLKPLKPELVGLLPRSPYARFMILKELGMCSEGFPLVYSFRGSGTRYEFVKALNININDP